ncbi:hypothetical protein nbrc107696_44350 [Gordonia spumicola]|uniref:DUF664 domain-containing protein n=1 Tax=Gordonia spumicola TaxID=589161 RepID=A0A7I9VF34_9ACTN|nr:DUF664 domain-containing protein [Gordonia spumicola]GEE03989.1 hypothetical protein nbrc107696_44350 [Gordonia spumicola]
MYGPEAHDEITSLVNYIDQQLEAIRAAALGLTEEQAWATPCRSALSVAGIIKHAEYGMRGGVGRLTKGPGAFALDEAGFAAYLGSFAAAEGETAAAVIARFDATRAEFLDIVRSVDPDADSIEPAAPWDGVLDDRPIKLRYYLMHQVEEYARHAGHADIVREQIDGQPVPGLVLSLLGAPANDFFAPYEAAPGTLLS